MKKKKKKSELTRLTLEIRLTRQTLDLCRESSITKQKKKLTDNPELTGLTRQTKLPMKPGIRVMKV